MGSEGKAVEVGAGVVFGHRFANPGGQSEGSEAVYGGDGGLLAGGDAVEEGFDFEAEGFSRLHF